MKTGPLEIIIFGREVLAFACVQALLKKGIHVSIFTDNPFTKIAYQRYGVRGVSFVSSLENIEFDYALCIGNGSVSKKSINPFQKVRTRNKKIAVVPYYSSYEKVSLEDSLCLYYPLFLTGSPSKNKLSLTGLTVPSSDRYLYGASSTKFIAFLLKTLFSFRERATHLLYYNDKKLLSKDQSTTFTESSSHISDLAVVFEPQKLFSKDHEILSVKSKSKVTAVKYKKTLKLIFLSLFLYLLPFFFLFVGGGFIYGGLYFISRNNIYYAKKMVAVARPFTFASTAFGRLYSNFPLLGIPYKRTEKLFTFISAARDFFADTLPFTEDVYSLFAQIIDPSQPVDFQKFEILARDSDYLVNKVKLLRNDLSEVPTIMSFISPSRLSKLDTFLVQSGEYSKMVENIPSLLGKDDKKTYMILFQNNMELRPTGGFIGSFAIVTFEKGKLQDTTVYDVYSADGQLKGHVEPPFVIRTYFEHPNWFLRDANWDPDFSESAKTIEWFLHKELDITVDGVIGVDLEFVRKLLEATGAITLSDFNLTIDTNNFYEVTQREIEEKFFPGSKRKAKLLTEFVDELQVKTFDNLNGVTVGSIILESLSEKHLQILTHNTAFQRAIDTLGWGGVITKNTCGNNCIADTLSVIDANLGVNKANYHLKRKFDLEVSLIGTDLTRKLQVTLENAREPSITPNEIYKTYLRVLIPKEAKLKPISVKSADGSLRLIEGEEFERKDLREEGLWIEVPAGETVQIAFTWTTTLIEENLSSYNLLWYKQAGTLKDPLTFNFIAPQGKVVITDIQGLTHDNIFLYNSELSSDKRLQLRW